MICGFFNCYYFKFLIILSYQPHKIPLLSYNISSCIYPDFLVLKKHLNMVAEKSICESCLKELSPERSGTSVEDVRPDIRFGGM